MTPEEAGLELVRDIADLVIENAQLRRRLAALEAVNAELVRRMDRRPWCEVCNESGPRADPRKQL